MAMPEHNDKTLLYADYSERNIRTAKAAIDPLGFADFIRCDDREKTIELVGSLKPDIVLIGLYLDGMRGISTIRAIRESITTSNRHGEDVIILLGAPKLDRRAMRDAVEAGIEGIFRQPVDPERLRKIITSVMRKPRRFVLEDNYFGPARPQDLAKDGAKPNAKRADDPATSQSTDEQAPSDTPQETPQRRSRDKPNPIVSASVTLKPNGRRRSDGANTSARPQRDLSDLAPQTNSRSNNGQTFDDGELAGVPKAGDQSLDAHNIKAVLSARELLKPAAEAKPEPVPTAPPAKPDNHAEPVDAAEDDALDTELEADDLIEIDLQEALVEHKLWVDTGGKEGAVMSIEHADLRDADLEGIDLSRCGLRFASFKNANCKNAVLRRCDLTAANFVESNLESANLAASRLSGARFNEATLRNTVFLGSDLSNASFKGMAFINCDLSGTNLAGADFRDADLSGANGLFAEQIQRARVNTNTRLPRHLKLRS